MLTICTDTFPQTCLSYVAFRIAFMETLERIVLDHQMGSDSECFGFLTEVPFLRHVPAHVQLDLLAATWRKHVASDSFEADLVDESVVYAVCETAARFVEENPEMVARFLQGGPLDAGIEIDHFLASELRSLHLNLSNEGDFLLISQFEDMHPDESQRMKREFHLDEARLEPLFDVLGRWAMSEAFLGNLTELLSKHEIVRSALKIGVG